MANDNSGNSTQETAGGDTASADGPDSLLSAAQELQSTLLRFIENTQNSQEEIATLVENASEQSAAAVRRVLTEMRSEVRKLESWIKNNRR